jgi:hypothetical protein
MHTLNLFAKLSHEEEELVLLKQIAEALYQSLKESMKKVPSKDKIFLPETTLLHPGP